MNYILFFHRLLTRVIPAVLFVLFSCQFAHAEKLKSSPQFSSENSATVLGLDAKNTVSEQDIKMAAKRLLSKYHPDKYGSKDFTDADRLMANVITKKILAAQDSLVHYLKLNPSYNPSEKSGSPSASQYRPESQYDQKFYTWQDFASDMSKDRQKSSGAVTTMEHYGSSLRGTMFEFLYQFPDANLAYLELFQASAKVNNQDALLILRPEIFPIIEMRIISRETDANKPQLVRSVFGKYVRGHHQGNSGQNLVDAIVFDDGRHFPKGYYMLPMFREQTKYQGEVTGDVGPKAVRMSSSPQPMFLVMKPSGYSDTEHGGYTGASPKPTKQFLPPKPPTPVQPEQPKLGWRDVKVQSGSDQTIMLGHTPTDCPADFGKLGKKRKK